MGIEWANILQRKILVYFTPQKKGEVSYTKGELILSTMCEGTSQKKAMLKRNFQRRTRTD